MSKKSTPNPPVPLFRGRVEHATYRDPLIPGYQGNPLIEALPPIRSRAETAKAIMCYPKFREEYRTWPDHLRFHLIYDAITDFFQPLSDHLDIAERFARAIRLGYKRRNPTCIDFWADAKGRLARFEQNMHRTSKQRIGRSSTQKLGQIADQVLEQNSAQASMAYTLANPRAFGFNMIGISGIGKTTAIQKVLGLYPQVIFHSRYRERDFPWTQIVWLKLDVPHDGSIKGTCLNFFRAIDSILDTNYFNHYTRNGKASATEMIPFMAWVAGLHTVGILVEDELQNLNAASSGGYREMLNFFVRLDNDMGIPIQKTGTYGAFQFLGTQLREARRGAGQAEKRWDPMANDEKWKYFLRNLWEYQYVQEPVLLTNHLSDVMHDVTQGITDFTINIFMLSQIRAIKTSRSQGGEPGGERLTESIIRSVAADSLNSAQPVLDALRTKNRAALYSYEDTQVDWTGIWENEIEDNSPPVLDVSSEDNEQDAKENGTETSSKRQRPKRRVSKRALKGSLPELLEQAEKKKVSIYEVLKEAGHIRSLEEFL